VVWSHCDVGPDVGFESTWPDTLSWYRSRCY